MDAQSPIVSVPKGKLTLVVGPTASGKTTLLLALLGQLKLKTEGEDQATPHSTEMQKKGVAYVPQKASPVRFTARLPRDCSGIFFKLFTFDFRCKATM